MVQLTILGEEKSYKRGIRFEEVVEEYQNQVDGSIAVVIHNGKMKELHKTVESGGELSLVSTSDAIGKKIYARTAIMLLMKAANDILQTKKEIKVEFSIDKGIFCKFLEERVIDDVLLDKLQKRMEKLIDARLPIEKKSYSVEEAVKILEKQGMKDKIELFRYRKGSFVNLYCIDGYYDYFYGYMLANTRYLSKFKLLPYKDGIILVLPSEKNCTELKEFKPQNKLFATMAEFNNWGEKQGISTVSDLNRKICEGKVSDIILVQEAFQERRIAEIANEIVARGGVKFVMIAGPSSSGKTSFSNRLSIQLQTHGYVTHPIAVDDYFVNREQTPKDENGDYNFECLEAIDTEAFNKDMSDLLEGKRVELPSFNFVSGRREYHGNFKQLGKDDILIIEGIHGLNDKMSYALPADSKFKIYISALTCLNVDHHNRIPTTDGRLLRRMVRDARTRGTVATRTLQMWSSVRRGEEENIFPFQESADVMFNSALIYEIAVLKTYAEPLLYGVSKDVPEYLEAQRLLKFLQYFLAIPADEIPKNSLVREFCGGSCFKV